jgi:hypothetical protein
MKVFLLDGKIYKCYSSGFDLLIYINDVHKLTDNDAKVVLFADDTSITVTTCNEEAVQKV